MAKSALTENGYNLALHNKFKKIDVKINLKFMHNHNGLRFGSLHTLIGTSGSGKSAVMLGVVSDIVRLNMDSVYIWLSEEKYDDFMYKLNKIELSDDEKSKIIIESDVDKNSKKFHDYKSHIDYIYSQMKLYGCTVLIFDNLTTYIKYAGQTPSIQSDISLYFKQKTADQNIALFIIAHTKKDIPDNADYELNESHIRGSSTITNITEYMYIYQRFSYQNGYIPIVRVAKHRAVTMLDTIYLLSFSLKKMSYVSDCAIDFETYKEHFLNKNTLKKRR